MMNMELDNSSKNSLREIEMVGSGRAGSSGRHDYGNKDYGRNEYSRNDYGHNQYGHNDYGHSNKEYLSQEEYDQYSYNLEHAKTNYALEHSETFQTTYEQAVEGKLFHNGELIMMPAATRDPNDPMNIPFWHKIAGVFCLSFFGALAASAEIILGACLPVFALEYAGLDPKILDVLSKAGFPVGADPLAYLEHLGSGPSIFDVYLLAALPLLMIGVSNLFLIPLAIAIGRRPVVLGTGLLACLGCVWAGSSGSLGSHLGARCVQAIGAGTVESLIPFIIQDIVHVHQRNTWISSAFAAQGVIIIAIGFSAPYVIINMSWRWVYFITAISAAFFLTGVFFFLPETRFNRTRSEMNGVPRNDAHIPYRPRRYLADLAPIRGPFEWKKGFHAFIDTLKTFFYPQIFFITMLNGAMISSAFAASYVAAPALMTNPWKWPFKHLGFSLIAVLVAALFVSLVQGKFADLSANWLAKKRGQRIPENQLINLVLPTTLGCLGSLLFGLSGGDQSHYPWIVFMVALAFLAFGFLGTSAIGTVYVLECYPHLAGPALVSIASFRFIIAFLFTFDASNWVVDMGYLNTFLIYTGVIGLFMVFIPIVYIFGPGWRRRWPADKLGDGR